MTTSPAEPPEWPADDDGSWRAVAKRWECLYREAVGLPVAEHTARRMEAIAAAAEKSAARIAQLEADLAAAEAKLAAVEALADGWVGEGIHRTACAYMVRAALATQPAP